VPDWTQSARWRESLKSPTHSTRAHRHGLIHRDVKPGNILLCQRGATEHAYLTDFRITKERTDGSELTRTRFAMGTADSMAPEQAQGADMDQRADIYALGCVLFRAVTGVVPSSAPTTLRRCGRTSTNRLRLLDARPELPVALAPILERALAKRRAGPAAVCRHAGAEALAVLASR
jgi:serine/threonine protein kinase